MVGGLEPGLKMLTCEPLKNGAGAKDSLGSCCGQLSIYFCTRESRPRFEMSAENVRIDPSCANIDNSRSLPVTVGIIILERRPLKMALNAWTLHCGGGGRWCEWTCCAPLKCPRLITFRLQSCCRLVITCSVLSRHVSVCRRSDDTPAEGHRNNGVFYGVIATSRREN